MNDSAAQDLRPLTGAEAKLIARLLAVEFPGRDALTRQLSACEVRTIDEDGSLEIQAARNCSKAQTHSRVPTEGEVLDRDGCPIHVLLHVLEGFAVELELYREDGKPVLRFPESDNMNVFASEQ